MSKKKQGIMLALSAVVYLAVFLSTLRAPLPSSTAVNGSPGWPGRLEPVAIAFWVTLGLIAIVEMVLGRKLHPLAPGWSSDGQWLRYQAAGSLIVSGLALAGIASQPGNTFGHTFPVDVGIVALPVGVTGELVRRFVRRLQAR